MGLLNSNAPDEEISQLCMNFTLCLTGETSASVDGPIYESTMDSSLINLMLTALENALNSYSETICVLIRNLIITLKTKLTSTSTIANDLVNQCNDSSTSSDTLIQTVTQLTSQLPSVTSQSSGITINNSDMTYSQITTLITLLTNAMNQQSSENRAYFTTLIAQLDYQQNADSTITGQLINCLKDGSTSGATWSQLTGQLFNKFTTGDGNSDATTFAEACGATNYYTSMSFTMMSTFSTLLSNWVARQSATTIDLSTYNQLILNMKIQMANPTNIAYNIVNCFSDNSTTSDSINLMLTQLINQMSINTTSTSSDGTSGNTTYKYIMSNENCDYFITYFKSQLSTQPPETCDLLNKAIIQMNSQKTDDINMATGVINCINNSTASVDVLQELINEMITKFETSDGTSGTTDTTTSTPGDGSSGDTTTSAPVGETSGDTATSAPGSGSSDGESTSAKPIYKSTMTCEALSAFIKILTNKANSQQPAVSDLINKLVTLLNQQLNYYCSSSETSGDTTASPSGKKITYLNLSRYY